MGAIVIPTTARMVFSEYAEGWFGVLENRSHKEEQEQA